MEVVLRRENDVQFDALTVVDFTLSSQDEFVDDDEKRRVRSGSRTSSKAGKTNV